jgi:hypothetical protein
MYCYRMFIAAAALCAAAIIPSCHRPDRTDSAWEIKLYPEGDTGYGYAVYQGTRKLIDQPNIPGVQGKIPFRTLEEAKSTAQLVSRKLQAHQFPPVITIQELDSLQIHYQ